LCAKVAFFAVCVNIGFFCTHSLALPYIWLWPSPVARIMCVRKRVITQQIIPSLDGLDLGFRVPGGH
jgi:hypothetical protein